MKSKTRQKKVDRKMKRRWFADADERLKELFRREASINNKGVGKNRSRNKVCNDNS